jgi:hypothetical protein
VSHKACVSVVSRDCPHRVDGDGGCAKDRAWDIERGDSAIASAPQRNFLGYAISRVAPNRARLRGITYATRRRLLEDSMARPTPTMRD